ncbi:hypothetical protein F4777DRAFT_221978 [Nemania sp. FL0916]|nr:hypothetical protein F4777DRAFT_221978 [Nemania sp. FL0916]
MPWIIRSKSVTIGAPIALFGLLQLAVMTTIQLRWSDLTGTWWMIYLPCRFNHNAKSTYLRSTTYHHSNSDIPWVAIIIPLQHALNNSRQDTLGRSPNTTVYCFILSQRIRIVEVSHLFEDVLLFLPLMSFEELPAGLIGHDQLVIFIWCRARLVYSVRKEKIGKSVFERHRAAIQRDFSQLLKGTAQSWWTGELSTTSRSRTFCCSRSISLAAYNVYFARLGVPYLVRLRGSDRSFNR